MTDLVGVPPHTAREVLRRLELEITRRLDGLLHGDHRGLTPGHGSDPGEARQYTPGDDVRMIDWAVTARTQHPHVRVPIADRELETWVVVDRSASLDFGTVRAEKRELAIAATAAVGFLTARSGNRFGAILAEPGTISEVPPRGGRDHLMAILARLQAGERHEGAGPADMVGALSRLASSRRRRGLVVVISDLLDDGWMVALKRTTIRHEVLVVELIDPREMALPDVGIVALVDPETGAGRTIDTSSRKLRERYATAAHAKRERHVQLVREARADHLVLRTDQDWLLDLVRFVAARRDRLVRR